MQIRNIPVTAGSDISAENSEEDVSAWLAWMSLAVIKRNRLNFCHSEYGRCSRNR